MPRGARARSLRAPPEAPKPRSPAAESAGRANVGNRRKTAGAGRMLLARQVEMQHSDDPARAGEPGVSASARPPAGIAFGPFVLDPAAARLTRHGQPVSLAPRPLALLAHLADNAGRMVTKDAL